MVAEVVVAGAGAADPTLFSAPQVEAFARWFRLSFADAAAKLAALEQMNADRRVIAHKLVDASPEEAVRRTWQWRRDFE